MKFPRQASRRALRSLSAAVLTLFFVAGCDEPLPVPPQRIVMVGGDDQCGLPGTRLPEPLVVRVLGPRGRDFLGRRGTGAPAVGVPVTFRVERLSEYRRKDEPKDADEPLPGDKPGPGYGNGRARDGGILPYPTLLGEDLQPGANPRRLDVTTDDSGLAKVWVMLGSENDDWRVEAFIEETDPETGKREERDKVHYRIVSGVEKIIERREANVGERVSLSLKVAEWREGGEPRPLKDRVVFFRLVGEPFGTEEGAYLTNRRDETDKDGVRKKPAELTLGDRPGIYNVLAEVEPYTRKATEESPESEAATSGGEESRKPPTSAADEEAPREDRPIRGILFRVVAMDWYLVTMKILGGALLFLIGVRFLANGFLLILSPYLRLEKGPWMENRLLGYLCGGLAGATFQSWSTVSSHLVSFANGGLLTGHSGLKLLLGASLGATVLPQVLSLELGFLTVPLLAIGLFCLVLPRGQGMNSWGWVFLGGGLVLASWSLFGDGTELLSLSESFRRDVLPGNVHYSNGFLSFSRTLLWILLLGLVVGFLLRTSNLVVILGMLLASHGIIGAATAIPLIIGANLGSAILLFARSSLKNMEARRLATVGLGFHFFTALFFTFISLIPVGGQSVFLWLVEWLTPGKLFHPIPESMGHHLAMAHTLYNLAGGLFFLAFPRALFRVAERVLPRRKAVEAIKPQNLDANLIAVPSLALRQVSQELVYLTEMSQKAIAEAFDAFRYGDLRLSDHVVRREETIAGIHRDVTRYLVLVGENQLSRHDASQLEILQTTAGALTRIGECAERLHELASRRLEEKVESSDETDRELSEVYDLVLTQFDNVVTLLQRRDQRVIENVMKMVERLAKYRTRLETQWHQRIEESETGGMTGVQVHMQTLIYQEAFDLLFRVASHLGHASQRMRILSPDSL